MKRLLILSLMILISLGSIYAQKIYVVAAGVADYPGSMFDLKLTVNDAKTIKWVYDKNKKAETVLLTDSQATKSNIMKQLKASFSKATANDIVLFFFSGHGNKEGFIASGNENISYNDIKNVFAECKSKNKMIFADACFSGKLRESSSSSSSSEKPNIPDNLNVLLFLSSRSNEFSIERHDMNNGFFTTYLQKALRGGADVNKDRKITAKELFSFVNRGVVEISGGRQHPVMWGKFSDNMPVIVW